MNPNQGTEHPLKAEETEEFEVCCGGIKPIILPEAENEEDEECTEQF